MDKFPKLKKKITSFLTKEEGKISKEAIIRTGILLSAAAIASLNVEGGCPASGAVSHDDHCNDLSLDYVETTATGTHNNAHGSHASHGSHGSHTSW